MSKDSRHFLKPSRLHQGEAKILTWYAVIEENTPYEALFEPTFWASHAKDLDRGHWIVCEPDEGHYTAKLRVMSTGVGGVCVEEYYKKEWGKEEAPLSLLGDYEVKWAGPQHKWRVMRTKDNHVAAKGFENEAAANKWLADNIDQLQR